jgi:hypothetical protein
MPVYTRDILASCADMTCSQFGGYMRLLLYAWDSSGLPNDMEACCRIAGGMSPEDWAVCRRRLVVLDAGTSEERLSHPRLEAERAKQQGAYDRKVSAVAKARSAKGLPASPVVNLVVNPVNNPVNNPVVNPVNNLQPEPEPEPDTLKSIRRRTKIRPPAAAKISWTAAGGFEGVCEISRSAWRAAFPRVDIDRELARCHAHAVSNRGYARKTDWNRALKAWLSRAQEYAEAEPAPAAPRAVFRPDAGREMTAGEYESWKRARMRDEYVRSKERKRGVTSIGDAIDGRTA